jgi:hypothetical protein
MKMILISDGKISSTEIFYCKKGSLHGFYRKCSSNGQLEGNFLFIFKDAGFVYESFRNETNRVIWKKNFHETNPRNESFKNESMKRIHETNLLNTVVQNESTK